MDTLLNTYTAFYFHQILKQIYCILLSPNSLIHALYFTIRELFNTYVVFYRRQTLKHVYCTLPSKMRSPVDLKRCKTSSD